MSEKRKCANCGSEQIGTNNGYVYVNHPDRTSSVCVEVVVYYCFDCCCYDAHEV